MNILYIGGAEYARGWWVTKSDMHPIDWTWNDRGNGPELIRPDAAGPFATEVEAEAYEASQSLPRTAAGDMGQTLDHLNDEEDEG